MGLRSATAPAVGRGNFATGMLIFTEAGEENFFISGLENAP
jgi:hypothetical protein